MATVVYTSVESTRGEPGFGDSTVVVAPTAHHTVEEGWRGADGTQPHRPFVQNSSDTMAQPPIENIMLGAVRDGHRVDVGTLPQGVQWKHALHCSPLISTAHLVRLLLESTLVSQCPHDAMAPGSRTLVANPLERLPATSVMHNAARTSPWTCPIVSGLLSRRNRLALRAALSPSSSRVGSAHGIRPASYHPEGFYIGARSPARSQGASSQG